jgi:hypothetical protein
MPLNAAARAQSARSPVPPRVDEHSHFSRQSRRSFHVGVGLQ